MLPCIFDIKNYIETFCNFYKFLGSPRGACTVCKLRVLHSAYIALSWVKPTSAWAARSRCCPTCTHMSMLIRVFLWILVSTDIFRIPIYRYSDIPIFRYSDIPIFRYVSCPVHKLRASTLQTWLTERGKRALTKVNPRHIVRGNVVSIILHSKNIRHTMLFSNELRTHSCYFPFPQSPPSKSCHFISFSRDIWLRNTGTQISAVRSH